MTQEKITKLVKQLVNNRVKTGMTQTDAMAKVYTDLKARGSTLTPSFIYWAVTGRYL
jgi:hypothetical protein